MCSCPSVFLCVRNQTSLKRLKLRTSNLERMFPATLRTPGHDPLKIFEKGAWPGARDPLNFWALNANSSKKVKATEFKFDVYVSREGSRIDLDL